MNRTLGTQGSQAPTSRGQLAAVALPKRRTVRSKVGQALTGMALGGALAGCQAAQPAWEQPTAGAGWAGSGWAGSGSGGGGWAGSGSGGGGWAGSGSGGGGWAGSGSGGGSWDGGPSLPPPAQRSTEPELRDWQRYCQTDLDKYGAPQCSEPDTLSVDELLETIALDLEAAKPSTRPFLRYFSLAQILNSECGRCSSQIRTQRFALSKFVNSLSLAAEATPPRQLDALAAVYAIDLRDYAWDRSLQVEEQLFPDVWEALAAHTDNAYTYTGPEADRIRAWALSPLPVLNLPAAVVAGIKPPLYSAILRLPQEIDAFLEAALGYRPEPGLEQRAAFTYSGLVWAERLVERWERADGAGVWRLVDFRPNTDMPSLFTEPLSSAGDGSQVLFPLPNGLLAFSVFDGSGTLAEEYPLQIDPGFLDGRMSVAGSCFSCHQAGIVPITDQLGPFARANPGAFSSATMRAIEERYPTEPEFDELSQKDSGKYWDALEAAGIPRGTPDGVATVLHRYERSLSPNYTDPDSVAGELMVTEEFFSENLHKIPLALRRPVGRRILNQHYLEAYCTLHAGDRNQLEACSD